MKIEENVRLSELIDLYGELLSPKQKNMLVCYVNQDYSLGEIANFENISRTAVLDAIKKAKQKLFLYEQKLGLLKLKQNLTEISKLDDKTCKSKLLKMLEEI